MARMKERNINPKPEHRWRAKSEKKTVSEGNSKK
jgi:hypothetical protein